MKIIFWMLAVLGLLGCFGYLMLSVELEGAQNIQNQYQEGIEKSGINAELMDSMIAKQLGVSTAEFKTFLAEMPSEGTQNTLFAVSMLTLIIGIVAFVMTCLKKPLAKKILPVYGLLGALCWMVTPSFAIQIPGAADPKTKALYLFIGALFMVVGGMGILKANEQKVA